MITLEFYNRKNNYMEVKTKFNVGNKVKIHVLGTPYITWIKYIKINHDTLMYAVSVFGTEICLPEHMLRPVKESSNRKEQAQIAAVENACKRLKEVDRLDFAVAAIADYDNGLTTGFKDGVEWADKTIYGVNMIPRIRRNRDKNFAEYKWEVKGKGFTNLCYTLWQAFHNWLWCCGVKPSIAFWWIKFKSK